jgi:hypothetical protein
MQKRKIMRENISTQKKKKITAIYCRDMEDALYLQQFAEAQRIGNTAVYVDSGYGDAFKQLIQDIQTDPIERVMMRNNALEEGAGRFAAFLAMRGIEFVSLGGNAGE